MKPITVDRVEQHYSQLNTAQSYCKATITSLTCTSQTSILSNKHWRDYGPETMKTCKKDAWLVYFAQFVASLWRQLFRDCHERQPAAVHTLQNHTDDGLSRRRSQLKWCHSMQLSHSTHCMTSADSWQSANAHLFDRSISRILVNMMSRYLGAWRSVSSVGSTQLQRASAFCRY